MREPFADDYNADGSLRCVLCRRDPCACGKPKPDAPAGDARDDEQDVEYIAAQLSNELGLSFRPRDTARKIIDFVVALRGPAIERAARAEGAAEERLRARLQSEYEHERFCEKYAALSGQLEACEQHVKILAAARDAMTPASEHHTGDSET